MYLTIKYGWHAKQNAFCHGDEFDKDISKTLGEYGFFLVAKDGDLKNGERHLKFKTEERVIGPSSSMSQTGSMGREIYYTIPFLKGIKEASDMRGQLDGVNLAVANPLCALQIE